MTGILGGIGGIISTIFGEGSIAQQFFVWGVASSVINAATTPFIESLTDDMWSRSPLRPLTPAELADMSVRGIVTADYATTEAARSGIDATRFNYMVLDTGEPPAIEQMLQLYRRGLIDEAIMEKAIRESRVRDEWVPYVLEMGKDLPTPVDALQALVEGQIDQATAEDLYVKLGGDDTYFTMLLNTRGEGPSPNEAATMAKRGLIAWDGIGPGVLSYEQAVKESRFRDKWTDAFKGLANYIPPPRTIGTLYTTGSITQEQALQLYSQAGLSPELAAAFLNSASSSKTAKHRDLAVSTIESLYAERAITQEQAMSYLTDLGYSSDEATFVLQVNDMKRYERFVSTAISAVHTEYTSHKIDRGTASATLDALQLASTERDSLLNLWTIERGAKVRVLTEAQVHKAVTDGIWDVPTGTAALVQMGYSESDAGVLLQE
jgi:hypothetical protein